MKKQTGSAAVAETSGVPAVIDPRDEALAALGIGADDHRGKEGIGAGDVKPFFLKIAQKMSDELEPSHRNYMDDLRANMLFVTRGDGPGEIIGNQAEVIIVALRKHAIQFANAEKGIAFEKNVPFNDPRTQFGKDGSKPVATQYYDFAALVLPTLQPVVLSMKATNLDTAKSLNGALTDRRVVKGPTFAYAFTVGTRPETRTIEGKNVTFGVFDILNLKNPRVVTPEQFKIAERAYATATEFLSKADHSVVEGEVFGEEREPGSDDM
jgi:hypothetical protein